MTLPGTDPIIATLTAARHRRGLSRGQVGIRLGLKTGKSVGDWESEHCSPSLSSTRRWADALGYDLALVPRQERA